MAAAAAFVLTIGSSPVFAQRGGGGGRAGGGAVGRVGGGMGGGHAMGGGHPTGAGRPMSGGQGRPTGGAQPAGSPRPAGGGQPAGGGHPQGTPPSGPNGDARPHSNPNAVKGDGRGGDHHERGQHFDHGDHDRHFDHGDHGRHFDHGDHDRHFNHRGHFGGGVFYYDPFRWDWSYPYYSYPYYPYIEYQLDPDYSHSDPAYGRSGDASASPFESGKGGISFAVVPSEALVFVDGSYVGLASSFGGSFQPLSLSAGSHEIKLVATGYEPAAFRVNVVERQVIPCQVSLKPSSDR